MHLFTQSIHRDQFYFKMTTTTASAYVPTTKGSATDFVTYIDSELVAIFKKEYGEHFDVIIDMKMKKRTRDIMERHARRYYGRTLEQDNSDATLGFYFAYTPFGYLYGQPLPSHKAMEWLTGTSPDQEVELAKSKAAEINFQGETLFNPPDLSSQSLRDSDNSRHTFAQKRKLQTSVVTSQFLDKYTEPEKWW